MAAIRSGWIPTVVSKGKMTLAFSLLILLLTGLPQQGDSTSPASDSKAPTAKECRQHVEKALDQYFEAKSRDQETKTDDTTPPVQTPSTNKEDDNDDDDSPVTPIDKNKTQDTEDVDDDDGDDDDDDEEDETHKKSAKDDDDDEEDDDDDDEDEDDNTVEHDKDEEDDDEDDEDDEDEEDISNEQAAKLDAKIVEGADDEDDEDDDDDEENDENEEDEGNNNDNNDDEDETDDREIGNQDNITEPTESRKTDSSKDYSNKISSTSDKKTTEEEEEDDEEDEDDDDDEDEDDDDDTISQKDSDQSDEEVDDEDDEDEDDEDDEEDDEEDEHQETVDTKPIISEPTQSPTAESKEESKQVTGGSDSTATRVAQELSGSKPTTDQPKTQEIPKETEAKLVTQKPLEGTNQTKLENKTTQITAETEDDEDDDDDEEEEEHDEGEDDLDSIENIYEDDDDDDGDVTSKTLLRSRNHIDAILNLDEIGTGYDLEEDKLTLSIYKEIKKIHAANIKPMEVLYKFTDSTSRLLGDAEIYNKPMILFLGPWNTGKTSIINYLLGIERTPEALKTGTGITDVDFTVITHGDKRQTISGTELAADWRYASLQQFGQGFLDHFKAITMPHTLLKKVNLVDTPGILENRKTLERGYPFNDAFQWFIDRADAIYVVLDPTKVDVGAELGTVIDQLKGRDVQFILNKADTIRRSDLMRVVGQLFWNLSPLMGSTEAPVIYAVSLSSKPFNPTAPEKFLADQENNFLYDLKDVMDKRVENRILYARRHAVRVRNHAKMVDCYLATYYRHKSIFSNKKNVAKLITENPLEYHIYDGLDSLANVSRYDLPDASAYKNFFRLHPLYDFRPLASTCSYFRGCPMDRLDAAIATELPELLAKYKKAQSNQPTPVKQEGR